MINAPGKSEAPGNSDTPGIPLLKIRNLAVSFESDRGKTPAVRGLDLTIHPGQTLALVGESGCGKSVTALSILDLLPPAACLEGGEITFEGRDLCQLGKKEMRKVRGGEIAMIFQEPMTSLNPVYPIGEQVIEAVMLHQKVKRRPAKEKAIAALEDVGLSGARMRLGSYPHEFSGGMRQRVMIAMALACGPKLLIADEPTTALDVSIQARILTLLDDLKRRSGLSILFITHDLGVVAEVADVVCVMYEGRVVEYATVYELFARPLHPYTRGLLDAIPRLGMPRLRLPTLEKGFETPQSRTTGDANGKKSACLNEIEPGHWVACGENDIHPAPTGRPPDLDFLRDTKKAGPDQLAIGMEKKGSS